MRKRIRSRAYISWMHMKNRCSNPNYTNYKHYGGRGITVCERWVGFKLFLDDMGDPPEKHTLDRIDVNGNYEPSNCRWATMHEQQRNKTNNITYSYNGEDLSVFNLSLISVVSEKTLRNRLEMGWSVERAISTPKGSAKGERSGNAKYSNVERNNMVKMYTDGSKISEIVKLYKGTYPTISRIVKNWVDPDPQTNTTTK